MAVDNKKKRHFNYLSKEIESSVDLFFVVSISKVSRDSRVGAHILMEFVVCLS